MVYHIFGTLGIKVYCFIFFDVKFQTATKDLLYDRVKENKKLFTMKFECKY